MLIAICADLHFRGKDLDAANEQAAAMVMECVRREVDLLCIAGDIFDRPAIGDNHASTGAVAEAAIRMVRELTKHGINVLMIPGNHDQSGAASADALHVFDGMPMVTAIREVSVFSISEECPAIFCMPWSWAGDDPTRLVESAINLRKLKTDDKRLMLLAHVQVAGARMSGSFCCEPSPGKWQVSRAFLESLPVDHIALGDFHARQELVPGKGGYVGALRQLNFGEEGNPAGFEVWDSKTNQTEWVELDAAPRYWTAIDSAMRPEGWHEKDLMRVRFVEVNPLPETVKRLEFAGVVVEQILDRPERTSRAEVPAGVIESPHALIDLWAHTQNPPVNDGKLTAMHATFDRVFADKSSLLQEGDPQTEGTLTAAGR